MATTTLPAKQERVVKDWSGTKPARALTYPANAVKKQPQKVKQGEPFDPDDLSRRLQAYLAEQKIRSDRRRAQRAAQAAAAAAASTEDKDHHVAVNFAAPGQENVYHHVPKVAATAFSRTTTPNPMRQIHALSQPAVRTHLEQLHLDDSKGLKKSQAMDQAIAEREKLRQRNQFQRTQSMENAAEIDGYRGVYKPQQRSFMGETSHLKIKQDKKSSRPLSTGDLLDESEALASPTTKSRRKSKPTGFDMTERNNWTQAEQVVEAKRKEKEREKENPVVRKKQSSWILLGKRSPKPEKDKDEAVAGIGDVGSPPDVKSAKASFLARFKRHPG